jgi:hypothetical protein
MANDLVPAAESSSRGLSLHTFDDMLRFANVVAKTDFAPKDFRGKPESCFLAIQHGAEIGLTPMQSLQNIACINGRPSIWGDAALALVLGSSACEYVRERVEGEGDSAVAICEAKRRSQAVPVTARFSVADAKRAALWGKSGPWTQYPARMLQLRARGFALRDGFPDVLKGLITTEEAEDYPTVDATPAPAALPAKPQPKRLEAPKPGPIVDDPMGSARTAINAATTVKVLHGIVGRIIERTEQGVFSEAQNAELLGLADGKRELLEGPKGDAHEEIGPGPGKD